MLRLTSTYAYRERKGLRNEFRVGEGLVGQCAFEKDRILIGDVPGDYVRISSGLGEAVPLNIVVLPVIFEGQVKAVIELASFHHFKDIHLSLQIKRFKGLGEMNPKELFETTMNPARRKLLKIDVTDAVEAEEMFTRLMGEEVEPRKQFIEDNALNVRNLDV